MWEFICEISEVIWSGITNLFNNAIKLIKDVINFTKEIVNVMLGGLVRLLDGILPRSVQESPIKPFIANMDKLIENAPVSDQGLFNQLQQKKHNTISGYYDTRTGEIKDPTYAAADRFTHVAKDIQEKLEDDGIVIVG